MIEFLDLKSLNNSSKTELEIAFQRVLKSGRYILGNELIKFESEFAKFCEVENCIGVGNCLDALQLILHSLGISKGDEVIVPSNTYIATWLAVSNVGARSFWARDVRSQPRGCRRDGQGSRLYTVCYA